MSWLKHPIVISSLICLLLAVAVWFLNQPSVTTVAVLVNGKPAAGVVFTSWPGGITKTTDADGVVELSITTTDGEFWSFSDGKGGNWISKIPSSGRLEFQVGDEVFTKTTTHADLGFWKWTSKSTQYDGPTIDAIMDNTDMDTDQKQNALEAAVNAIDVRNGLEPFGE